MSLNDEKDQNSESIVVLTPEYPKFPSLPDSLCSTTMSTTPETPPKKTTPYCLNDILMKNFKVDYGILKKNLI